MRAATTFGIKTPATRQKRLTILSLVYHAKTSSPGLAKFTLSIAKAVAYVKKGVTFFGVPIEAGDEDWPKHLKGDSNKRFEFLK